MKTKMRKSLIFGMVATVLMSSFFVNNTDTALGLSRACQNSPECVAAAEKEEAANAAAAAAAQTANAYQNKVNELAASIASKEAEIAESEAEVAELKEEIEETEEEIEENQEALAELLVKKHFESDAEPIKILAGATSISDLAEKAAREQVAQEQINVQVTKIKDAKQKLEDDKAAVETKLAEQKTAREELAIQKQSQEELVAKYENDAEAYEAVAAAAREEKQAAEKAWQEAHQSEMSGLAYYSGDNTYPWQTDCPGKQDYYSTYINSIAVGGYVCECVSYVGWKAYEAYGLYLSWGNAYSWDDVARSLGYTVDNTPSAGSIGQVDGYPYGHVFWVESVNSDGSINVTEYNNYYATYLYSGVSRVGDFGARTIPAYEVGNYNYIHL